MIHGPRGYELIVELGRRSVEAKSEPRSGAFFLQRQTIFDSARERVLRFSHLPSAAAASMLELNVLERFDLYVYLFLENLNLKFVETDLCNNRVLSAFNCN